MAEYLVLNARISKTKTGSSFLSTTMLGTDGVKKQVNVWNIPSELKVSVIREKVISASIQEKEGFLSTKWESLSIVCSYDELPESSPLKIEGIKTFVTFEMFTTAVEAFYKKIPEPFVSFLNFIGVDKLFDYYGDSPAALDCHHAIKGGLKEHVYEMLSLYYNMSRSSVMSRVRHELVVIPILFHDYGKVEEYSVEDWAYQEDMPLFGHIYPSAHHLHNRLVEYNNQAPEELRIPERDIKLLVHVVLAHHRQMDWGSPVVPCIKEAYIMHFIDEMSGKTNMFNNIQNMDNNYYLSTRVLQSEL